MASDNTSNCELFITLPPMMNKPCVSGYVFDIMDKCKIARATFPYRVIFTSKKGLLRPQNTPVLCYNNFNIN